MSHLHNAQNGCRTVGFTGEKSWGVGTCRQAAGRSQGGSGRVPLEVGRAEPGRGGAGGAAPGGGGGWRGGRGGPGGGPGGGGGGGGGGADLSCDPWGPLGDLRP